MFSWLPNRLAMSGSLMAKPLRSPSTDCWLPMVVMFALWICAKRRPKVEALSVYLLVTVDALGKRRNSLCNIPGWIICYPFQSPAKEKNIVIIFRVAIMFGFATVFTRNRSLLVPLSVFVCALLASPKKRSDSVLIFTWKNLRNMFTRRASRLISVFNQLVVRQNKTFSRCLINSIRVKFALPYDMWIPSWSPKAGNNSPQGLAKSSPDSLHKCRISQCLGCLLERVTEQTKNIFWI